MRQGLIQEGPRNAKVMIVGEAPSKGDFTGGRPFDGGAGQILDTMLSRTGLRRSECFTTYVCHVPPPSGKNKKDPFANFLSGEHRITLLNGITQLKADIEAIKPNLIICLGSHALRFVTGKVGIEKWRGSILPTYLTPGLKAIGTFAPEQILKTYDLKAVAEMDLARASAQSKDPAIRYPFREIYCNPQGGKALRQFRDGIEWKSEEVDFDRSAFIRELSLSKWLSVDIECWLDPATQAWTLACVGFSDSSNRALVLHNYNAVDRSDIAFLCGCPAEKVLQNGTFDSTVLAENGITLVGFGEPSDPTRPLEGTRGWDTMLAHHALYPECSNSGDEVSNLSGRKRTAAIRKGLGFIASINTLEPFYKDDGKVWSETNDLPMFWRYNGLDAIVTRESRDVQEADLNGFGTLGVLHHEMSLVRPLMDATRVGLKVDLEFRKTLRRELVGELENLQSFLDVQAGESVNVKSTPQMHTLLYRKFGFKEIKKKNNKGEQVTTADKDAIIELSQKYEHPFLQTILAIRQRRDMLERYVDAKISLDGRIRCSFDITGTNTGRLSSRASLDGTGGNLQNQPDKIKQMYIADNGRVFVQRDYKQAEAWLVAYLAQEEGLITLLNDPTRDIHRENAYRIFGKALDAVTPDERQLAKKGGHSANYGVEAPRLSEIINQEARDSWGRDGTGVFADVRVAGKVLTGYHLLYPNIRNVYWRYVADELRRHRTLETPLGRKRMFFGRWDEGGKFLKEAYAYIPQSTVGDLCCKAMVRAYHMLKASVPTARVLLNVHDSIVSDCYVDDAERVAAIMEEAMRIELSVWGRKFIIPSDCEVGYNLRKLPKKNPERNPNGMRDIKKWLAAPDRIAA